MKDALENVSKQVKELFNIFFEQTVYMDMGYNGYIYHYTTPDGFLSITNSFDTKLWFTKYDSLNDINERLDIIEYLEKYISCKEQENVFEHEFVTKIRTLKPNDEIFGASGTDENTFFHQDSDTYVCCFSQENDLLPMWNYYSKSNRYEGYCIGFSVNMLEKFKLGYEFKIYNVCYSDVEKDNILDKVFIPASKIYSESTEEDKDMILRILQSYINEYQFLFKNEKFKHEKEVRAILRVAKDFSEDEEVSLKKYRNNNGYIIPYREVSFSNKSIYSVTVPPLLEKELAVNNMKEYLCTKNMSNVKVLCSNVPIRF